MTDLITALKIVTADTNQLTLWHGGNLDLGQDTIQHKKGRWEAGPGLYLTTHYATAKKYSKGSRKLYQVTIRKGTDIRDVGIDPDTAKEFVNKSVIKSKRPDILQRVDKHTKNGKLAADTMNNIMINEDALKASTTNAFRMFLVENGVDYSIQDNMYGWHERVVVIFNMDVIVDKKRIGPKDKIEDYDLPTEFS